MDSSDNDAAQRFEAHRRHLTGLAYRMLGSIAEAQDVVQETYLRWHRAERATVSDARAFLSRTAMRLCLDQLKSARARHEHYIGPWLPEPVLDEAALAAESAGDYAHDLSVALMLTLERLSPLERAAFLLHDVFDMDFDEVAETLGRNSASCRQLAARARARVRASRPRFRPSEQECERLVTAFGVAARSGDAAALAGLLTGDVIYYSDAGGRATSALKPIAGRDKVVRLITGLSRKGLATIRKISATQINGSPGFIVERAGGQVITMAFDFRDGLIANIYTTMNPDKLRHLAVSSTPPR
ncbi:MAG: RNA polymerase sigma factor SigJ [Candidatus Binataceae bacterium]